MDTAPASIVVSLAAPWRFRGNALCAVSQAASAETSRTCRGQDAARIVMVAAAASKRIVSDRAGQPRCERESGDEGCRSPACWPDSRLWHVLSKGFVCKAEAGALVRAGSTIFRPQGSAAPCLADVDSSRRASQGLAGDPFA
jgi:hypothetical protein